MAQQPEHDGAVLDILPTAGLDAGLRVELHDLFAITYAGADHSYLDRSLELLRFVAVARRDDTLVAFSLGELRVADLPRLPAQPIGMAGLSCVHPDAHRRGFFRRMAALPFMAEPMEAKLPLLVAGRMAHPVSMRGAMYAAGSIPRPGHVPTAWQQEVASAVAQLYGVTDFDPLTMICRGSGTPVGTPVLTLDVSEDEWLVFAGANHERGDSVLAVAWQPFPPDGWD